MNEVTEAWRRIENWLEANAPPIRAGLAPGATDAQIADAEAVFGVTFPDDLKASLRIHDGETHDVGSFGGEELLSLARMRDEWQVWKDLLDGGDFAGSQGEPEGPVKSDWWNPRWIPLTYNGSGDHQCLDLDPAPGGNVGQIIQMWHDWEQRKVLALSVAAWLRAWADALEAGKYQVVDGGLEENSDEDE